MKWPWTKDSDEVTQLKARISELERSIDEAVGMAKKMVDAYAEETCAVKAALVDCKEQAEVETAYHSRERDRFAAFRAAHNGCSMWQHDKEQIMAEVVSLRAELVRIGAVKRLGQ